MLTDRVAAPGKPWMKMEGSILQLMLPTVRLGALWLKEPRAMRRLEGRARFRAPFVRTDASVEAASRSFRKGIEVKQLANRAASA